MAKAIDAVERLIGRLYTTFVLRDLTFIFSGAVVLTFAIGKPLRLVRMIGRLETGHIWVIALAFLAVSYVLGVLLQEASRLIVLEKRSKANTLGHLHEITSPEEALSGSDPDDLKITFVNQQLAPKLERLRRLGQGQETLYAIERILFLKQIAATQCPTSIAVFILLFIRNVGDGNAQNVLVRLLIFASIFLIMIPVLCYRVYLEKALQQEKILWSIYKLGGHQSVPANVERIEAWLREPWWRRLFERYPHD